MKRTGQRRGLSVKTTKYQRGNPSIIALEERAMDGQVKQAKGVTRSRVGREKRLFIEAIIAEPTRCSGQPHLPCRTKEEWGFRFERRRRGQERSCRRWV